MDCAEEEQCRRCIEGLGFESSDRVDGGGEAAAAEEDAVVRMEVEMRRRRTGSAVTRPAGMRSRRFPPPISSLSCNGNPVFVLKAVRKDGRLRMSKVWINRPEILRAECCRENRLRLFVMKVDSEAREDEEEIKEHEEEEEEVEEVVSCGGGGGEGAATAEEDAKRWRLALCGNREGFQRCNRNQEMSLWNHQCLATS